MKNSLIKYAVMHGFPDQKFKHWIKSLSKFLFCFADIRVEVFTEGILDIYFYHTKSNKHLHVDFLSFLPHVMKEKHPKISTLISAQNNSVFVCLT